VKVVGFSEVLLVYGSLRESARFAYGVFDAYWSIDGQTDLPLKGRCHNVRG
jgi:hypothetical protein